MSLKTVSQHHCECCRSYPRKPVFFIYSFKHQTVKHPKCGVLTNTLRRPLPWSVCLPITHSDLYISRNQHITSRIISALQRKSRSFGLSDRITTFIVVWRILTQQIGFWCLFHIENHEWGLRFFCLAQEDSEKAPQTKHGRFLSHPI
jgi:hypothetical protein